MNTIDRIHKFVELGYGADHIGAVLGVDAATIETAIADPETPVLLPGLTWRGQWSSDSFHYGDDDLVADTDGGLYICILDHVSHGLIVGNEPSGPPWINACNSAGIPVVLPGPIPVVDRNMDWTALPVYDPETPYVRGDLVKTAGGYIKLALQDSTGQAPVDSNDANAYWGNFDGGGLLLGDYNSETAYTVSQVVTEGGVLYFCVQNTTGDDPATDNGAHWLPLPGANTYRGDWAADTDYALGDVININGQVWLSADAHRSVGDGGAVEPSVDVGAGGGSTGIYWELVVRGT